MAEDRQDRGRAELSASLLGRIEEKRFRVGVLGLGYVGLPLGLAFAESGFEVLGFDVDDRKVEELRAGRSYIEHLDGDRIARAVEEGRLEASSELDRLAEPDALLICVPTPLDRHREPNLEYVTATSEAIARRLRRGQLVVLESTTYPGTTEELVQPILETSGLTCGEDFFLAFSPEREDPGNTRYETAAIPKVVGGVGEAAAELAEALYRPAFSSIVRVSSARTAEATKLMENVFRAVNIALVNELKTVYDAMGIDIWEVVDAAATKPFGFMRFTPGPGWGGHCIPVDPFYLAWKAREYGLRARFIELAGEVNLEMPRYVLKKIQEALNDRGRAVRDARVLILGLAYKPDVADARESPAFEIIDRLLALGARVSYHDPFISESPRMRTWPDLPPMRSVALDRETLERQDAVVLVTNHSRVDYDLVARHAPLLVDTRGVYRRAAENVVPA